MGLIKLTAGRNVIKQCYLSNYPRAELQAGSSSSIAELSAGQLFSPPSRFQDLTQNQAIPVGKQEQNPTFSFLKTYSHAKMGGISPVLMNFWLWRETFSLHAHCFVTIPAGMDVKMPKRVIFETYRMLKDGCAREMNEASEAMHKPMLRWDCMIPHSLQDQLQGTGARAWSPAMAQKHKWVHSAVGMPAHLQRFSTSRGQTAPILHKGRRNTTAYKQLKCNCDGNHLIHLITSH